MRSGEAFPRLRTVTKISSHHVLPLVSIMHFEDALKGLRVSRGAGGRIARHPLEQGIIEIGIATQFFIGQSDMVECGGIERLAAAQRREDVVAQPSPGNSLSIARPKPMGRRSPGVTATNPD